MFSDSLASSAHPNFLHRCFASSLSPPSSISAAIVPHHRRGFHFSHRIHMWPFSKRSRKLEADSWMLGQTTLDGETIFIRIADSPTRKRRLTHRFGIAIPFEGVIDGKYPDAETGNYLAMLEDALLARFRSMRVEHVLALTLPNVRELVFYTSDPVGMKSALNEVRRQFPNTAFQQYAKEDRNWSAYQHFRSMFGGI